MSLIRLVIMCLGLVCSPITAIEDDKGWVPSVDQMSVAFTTPFRISLETDNVFYNKQSIANNKITFAGCRHHQKNKVLNCVVHIVVPTSDKSIEHTKCDSRYYLDEGKTVHRLLRLQALNAKRVLFEWIVTDIKDMYDGPFVVIRVINMVDCSYEDSGIALGELPYFHTLVFYNDTYDVFFRNKNACGDFMCGQTYDNNGKLINGPVSSYLPAEIFKSTTLGCPAQKGSLTLGHFVISDKIRLISSTFGKIKDLMDFPRKLAPSQSLDYSCDYGILGICWMEAAGETHVNCRQFNAQGKQIMSAKADLTYRLGSTMSVKNLRDGGLLLQTNKCEDDDWCENNLDQLTFFVHKIDKGGIPSMIYEINKISCGKWLKSDVDEKPNKDICVTFLCCSRPIVQEANVEVRAFIHCVGQRNVTSYFDIPEAPPEIPDEKKVPGKLTKPSVWGIPRDKGIHKIN